ncbi:MAG: ornithine cyclodeaminase family protein [Bacteroidota bacterium]
MHRKPVFVSAAATAAVLDWGAMIRAVRDAYALPHTPQTSVRAVARGDGTSIRGLVSAPPGSACMGAKVFGVARARQVTYLLPLFDQETGELVALIDALHITALRTAATSAVAADRLAPRRPAALGVLGSGAEAQAHVRALAAVRTLRGVRLFSPNPANRERAALDLERELGVPCVAVATAAAAVESADIVVAAARSRDETPILDGDWLAPGTLLVSIGSTVPEQRELDLRSIQVCDLIVCDAVHEVASETGDFLAARAAGVAFAGKLASLNDLVAHKLDARVAAARQPMYKSVGAAVQDVVIGELAYRAAVGAGLAPEIDARLEIKHV